jgi:hypothetical protein
VWFDKVALQAGDDWERKIRTGIHRAALFVPCVSRTTEQRDEGYFRREWLMACKRNENYFGSGLNFFWPIILDDLPDGPSKVPEEFRASQWARLDQGLSGFAHRIVDEVKRRQVAGLLDEVVPA